MAPRCRLVFHVETTPEVVLGWAAASPDVAEAGRPGWLEPERLAEVHADIAEVWQPFADRFVKLASGEIKPAMSGMPLPLV